MSPYSRYVYRVVIWWTASTQLQAEKACKYNVDWLCWYNLQAAKEALCSHKAARHIALHLLAPDTKRYLPAHAAAMLTPPTVAPAPAAETVPAAATNGSKPAEDAEEDDDIDAVGCPTHASATLHPLVVYHQPPTYTVPAASVDAIVIMHYSIPVVGLRMF